MRFSDSLKSDIPKPNEYANSDSSPFNSDTPLSEVESCKTIYPANPDTSSTFN